ncbi:MAG: rhodanese-like domain-containing protein [Propionibacteriaceae bacterium]
MNDHVKNLPVSELDGLRAAGWELLDVRTPAEWDEVRAKGATHIPLDQLTSRTEELGDKVVCLCAVGGRSAQAAQYLVGTGREVVNLDGGIAALQEQDHPILAS